MVKISYKVKPKANNNPNNAENLAVNSKVLFSCIPSNVFNILINRTANGSDKYGRKIIMWKLKNKYKTAGMTKDKTKREINWYFVKSFPRITAKVFLFAALSSSMSRKLFTTKIFVINAPTGIEARIEINAP